ncbi:MAG: ABC transporter ATP-binding protein [Pseudorhodobacter sp.]
MAGVSIRNVRKSYGGAGPVAVENLNLEIPDSEFLCLLGPSGCGKTTTLRMIAGLENLTDGEIRIGDRVVDSVAGGVFVPPEKREIGLVFQNYALWPHLTVEQNVEFGMKLRKVPKDQREREMTAVMETLGIAKYRKRYPSEMSGGQQQRVALARMLAVSPSVILLDEPLSNLDAKLRLEMRSELKRIHSELGSTFIFVTHDQFEAMTLATTIAVMSDGLLQQLGTPDDIYDRPANRFVAEFVGTIPINIIDMATEASHPLTIWAQTNLDALSLAGARVASVGIRPESIRFQAVGQAKPDAAAVTCAARIVDIVPTGGNSIVEMRAGGTPLFAIASDTVGLHVGDETNIWVQARHLHLFDAAQSRVATG